MYTKITDPYTGNSHTITSSKDFLMMGDFKKFLSAFLITFVLILGHITLVVIPKKANQLLLETYPEYKLAQVL